MSPEVHRAALRAAAKLALSAAFIGCGSAETAQGIDDLTTAEDSADDEGSTSDELRKKKRKKKATCVASYCSQNHPKSTEEACCKAEVAQASFPKTASETPGPDQRVDAVTRGCCDVLAKAADKSGDWGFPERAQCCPALGWTGSATCTPWGPPVPPAMRSVA
jgi:hypothetical protein